MRASGAPRVSLREKGVDLNVKAVKVQQDYAVSLREKGVDLNRKVKI